MEIRWLEAFVAVAEELHFGRAAARLRLAQSPLSQTIRKLERELGVDAVRPQHAQRRAHAGRARRCCRTPTGCSRSWSWPGRRPGRRPGSSTARCSIGFSGALNHLTLPPLTRAVRQRYPDVTLKLVGRVMTRDGVAQVERGALDLAFVALPLDPSPAVRTRLIAREPLGVALPGRPPPGGRAGRRSRASWPTTGFITTPVAAGSGLQEVGAAGLRERRVPAADRPGDHRPVHDPHAGGGGGRGRADVGGGRGDHAVRDRCTCRCAASRLYLQHALAWSADNPSTVLKAVLAVAEEVLPTPA